MGAPGSTWKPTVGKMWRYKCMLLNGLENFVDPAIVPLSERADLPPEVKAQLFSIDNLPRAGGVKDSIWYTPPPPTETEIEALATSPSLNPAAKGFNPRNTPTWVSAPKSDAEKSSPSSLDPAAKGFTPANKSKWVSPSRSEAGNSSNSALNPIAKAFVPSETSRVLKVINSVEQSAVKGLTESRWAQPASKTSTAKDLKVVEMNPMSPVKARDIPVHIRGYYIAPHLRPAGLKALPGKPLLPYIEPHQRVGILPEVIPNDMGYHTPSSKTSNDVYSKESIPESLHSTAPSNQVPANSPVADSGKDSSDGHTGRIPFLASSFEAFTGYKTLQEYNDRKTACRRIPIPTTSTAKNPAQTTYQMTSSKNHGSDSSKEHIPLLSSSFEEFTNSKTHEEYKNSKTTLTQASIYPTSVLQNAIITTSPASGSRKNGSDSPKRRIPFLASSFEEFTGCKTLEEYKKRNAVMRTEHVAATSHTIDSEKRGSDGPNGQLPFLAASFEEPNSCKTLEKYNNSDADVLKISIPTPSVTKTSPATVSEKHGSDGPKERIPFLASSFEEFTGCKTLEEYRRKTALPANKKAQNVPVVTTTNVIREYVQLPSDCYSTRLAPSRKTPKLQPRIQEKEIIALEAPRTAHGTRAASPARDSQTAATEQTAIVKDPDVVKSKLNSFADVPISDAIVQITNDEQIKDTGKAVDLLSSTLDSTRYALSQEIGAAPKDPFTICTNAHISDGFVKSPAALEVLGQLDNIQSYVGDSRGYLAKADEYLHYNGNWMPVVCSWENDRPEFDDGFIPQYIATWAKTVFPANGKVDTDREEFKSGISPLSLLRFEDPVQQPPCYPDVDQSDNRVKQLVQTAEIDSRNFANRMVKKQRIRERHAHIAAQQSQIAVQSELFFIDEELIVNANIPKIEIYLRPAENKDIPGITSIYNHYVLNSIITEDQVPIKEGHMTSVLNDAQEQGLPFIVAVKGQAPVNGRAKKAEHILGFAHTDFLSYGHCGSHTGASRFSGIIQLYVEHSQTRKGVGRSLLDRILVCSSSTHASKEGYQWLKPKNTDATVYGCQGGAHKFHQLFFHRHIEVKEDPDHEWFKQWLHSKFFIEEVARFKSAARSSNRGTTARMLDLLIFQFEAAITGGFDINL